MITANTIAKTMKLDSGVIEIGKWLAAPMKNNMGNENITFVREAVRARGPAAAAAGSAWPPWAA
jgi:hypothetical protein